MGLQLFDFDWPGFEKNAMKIKMVIHVKPDIGELLSRGHILRAYVAEGFLERG